jgi:hypothetical protein
VNASLPPAFDIQKFKAAGYYLNVHTPANQLGEIRGQLLSYAENIQPIFDANCIVCHEVNGIARTVQLFLTSDQSYSTLVNVNSTRGAGDIRVIPFDYETSVLYERTAGTGGFTGIARMPQSGVGLSAHDQNLIKSWIMMGAAKNGLFPPAVNAQFTRNALMNSGQTALIPVTIATGTARVVLDTVSTKLTGSAIVSGISPTNPVTAVELRDGIIGSSGTLFAALAETAPGSGVWTVPAGAPALDTAQRLAFRKAGFHILVTTTVNTTGELRGQLMSYAGNIQALFDTHCVICHTTVSDQFSDIVLTPAESYVRLVNQPATRPLSQPTGTRVIPFNATSSILYQRVSPTVPTYQMPFGGPYLSGQETDLIKVWIDMGAVND